MKKLLSLLVILSISVVSHAQNTFQRTVGGLRNTIMVPTNDSGYLMVASMELVTTGQDEVVIQKTDGDGVAQWIKAYGSTYDERIYSGVEHNGFYYLCGKRTSGSDTVGIIMKLNLSGNLIWSKTLDYTNVFTDIVGMSDGNLGVTGAGKLPTLTYTEMITTKIDTAGIMIWSVAPELNGVHDTARAVIEYGQGGLLTVGTSYYAPGMPYGVYFANNSTGAFVFKKIYTNSSFSDAALVNGNIYIGGMNMNVDDYLLLLRVDSASGDTISTITFGNYFFHKNVVNIHPAPFGFWYTGNSFNQTAYVTFVDPDGNLIWSKEITDPVAINEKVHNSVLSAAGRITLGGYTETGAAIPNAWMISGTDFGNFACNTTDVSAGWWHLNEPHTFGDIFFTMNFALASDTVQMPLRSVAIMDNFTCLTTRLETHVTDQPIAFPVPATDLINITYSKVIHSIEIISMNGVQVLSATGNTTNQVELNTSDLANGIYFAKISADNQASVITRIVISR